MTIEHNVVVVNGLEYKAVESIGTCNDCEFADIPCLDLFGVECSSNKRHDNKDVIFKRHYRPTHKELQK